MKKPTPTNKTAPSATAMTFPQTDECLLRRQGRYGFPSQQGGIPDTRCLPPYSIHCPLRECKWANGTCSRLIRPVPVHVAAKKEELKQEKQTRNARWYLSHQPCVKNVPNMCTNTTPKNRKNRRKVGAQVGDITRKRRRCVSVSARCGALAGSVLAVLLLSFLKVVHGPERVHIMNIHDKKVRRYARDTSSIAC